MSICYKVEKQGKSRPFQHEFPQPLHFQQTFNKGSSNHSLPTPSTPQKIQTPQINFSPLIKLKPIPKNIPRCFKCQVYGQTSVDYTNKRVITVLEWEAMKKEEKKEVSIVEEHGEEEESLEEVIEHADKGDLLTVKRVLVGLQIVEQEPHKDSFPTKEATTVVPLSIPLPLLKIFQTNTPFYSLTTKEPNPFQTFGKPSL